MYVKRLNIEPPWLPYHTGRPMQADLFPSLLCQKAPSEKQYFSGGNGLKGGLWFVPTHLPHWYPQNPPFFRKCPYINH